MGSKINQIQAMVRYYGKICYDDKFIANIFSITNMVNEYIVAYDSHQDDGFSVHTN